MQTQAQRHGPCKCTREAPLKFRSSVPFLLMFQSWPWIADDRKKKRLPGPANFLPDDWLMLPKQKSVFDPLLEQSFQLKIEDEWPMQAWPQVWMSPKPQIYNALAPACMSSGAFKSHSVFKLSYLDVSQSRLLKRYQENQYRYMLKMFQQG